MTESHRGVWFGPEDGVFSVIASAGWLFTGRMPPAVDPVVYRAALVRFLDTVDPLPVLATVPLPPFVRRLRRQADGRVELHIIG
jgi:hypothetical protein